MAQERRTVTISVDGFREREVDYVHFELNQQTDVEGQPTGPVRGGKITVKVKSTDDGNTEMFEWMCTTHMYKDGYISFPNSEGGEMKRLSFRKGYVVNYSETYDAKDNSQQYEEFVITAREIQIGYIAHSNVWTT